MVVVKVANSYCSLSGITAEDYRALKQLMSYQVDSGPGTRPRLVSLLSKKLEFPTGLLYIVKEYFKDTEYRLLDTRICPISLPDAPETLFQPETYLTPYPEQSAAIEALMANRGRGIVCAPTGFGKALMVAMTIDALKVKTLVVVPSLELKRQLTGSLLHWFGKANFTRFVTVANVDSLDTREALKDTDAVILDEVHHSAAKTYRDLNRKAWGNVYYRVGLTATPFRSQEDERLLFESFLSNVVYEVPYELAVEKKYIVPMEAYYLESPKIKLKGNQAHYPAMYSECVTQNEARNTVIALMGARLHAGGKTTLCLVREIKHGDILSRMTGLPFANGQDGESTRLIGEFNSGKIKTLIATVGVMGEGVDSKPAEFIIIAGGGKSRTQLMQCFGRGFRAYPGKESCKVILVSDLSHKWFKKHFKEQCKILEEEYGVAPVQIFI